MFQKAEEPIPVNFRELGKRSTFNIWSWAMLPRNFLSWENATGPKKP